MTYFIDFDRTIFDVEAFTDYMKERLAERRFQSLSPGEMGDALEEELRKDRISFASGELTPFVYVDVPEFLHSVGNTATIITYGNSTLQKAKIASALYGIPRINVFYTGDERKGAFLAPKINAYGPAPIVVDDMVLELEQLQSLCPSTRLFEMRRDAEVGDGRWPVIRSLSELP